MKTISWTILGAMLATSVIAQDNTNSLPAIPAPATSPAIPAPATSPAMESTPAVEPAPAPAPAEADTNATPVLKPRHRHIFHHKIKEPSVTLVPGPATVAADHVNVRGQAGLNGEVIAHVFKGDTITVLDQINLKHHASDEPAQWAKVSYPTNAYVWLDSKFIDTNNMVLTKKLNLRAGPGENFSVVGILNSGDSVTPVGTKGHWTKIEPPTNTYAFVAAMYLTQTASAPEVSETNVPPTAPEVEPTPTPVTVPQPTMTEQNNPPPAPVSPENAPVPVPAPITPETMPEVTYDPNLPRVVSHEGVVRHVISIITPTTYELYSPATDQNIDFLYTTSTNLDLSKYINMDIIVTGQEDLSAHWQIPVLSIQRIIVVNTNAVPQQDYSSPRQQQEHRR